MKSRSGGGDRAPYPLRVRVCLFDFDPFYVSQLVASHSIELRRIHHREKNEIDIGGMLLQRGAIGVFRKPESVRQPDQHLRVVAGKRLGAEKSVAQTAWLLLHYIKNLGSIIAFCEVFNDIGLLPR